MDSDTSGERARLESEVARLERALAAEREHADSWRQVAEERRVALERLRQHAAVRAALRVAAVVLPPVRRQRRRLVAATDQGRRVAAAARVLPHKLTAGRREQALWRAIRALPPPPVSRLSVTAIILTRNGHERLAVLLPALRERTAHAALDLVVVDNGSDEPTRAFLRAQPDVRVLRFDTNRSFAAANNAAAATSDADVLCFLNDDLEPVTDGWLPRMLAALGEGGASAPLGGGHQLGRPADGGGVVAVGAQLVYPRRPLLAGRTRDLGVQHRGVAYRPVPGGVPQAVNLGEGGDPDLTGAPLDVPAATAACLAVRREAFAAVGGFDEGYVYGAEDVDLCWRLRAAGGRIAVVPQAALFHHEGATRYLDDRSERNTRQRRNWERFAGKVGPALTRAVERDRLGGGGFYSPRPYQVAITVTRDLPEAGYGDYYTAHELGEALSGLGWEVRYVERYGDHWYDLPPDLDLLVVLLDTFDLRRVARPGLTTVAWVRNWTQRWLSHPWFAGYDIVLASSGRTAALIRDGTPHRPVTFPLATNPTRFGPGATLPGRCGVVFTGNHWGDDRGLPGLARAVPQLAVYGRNWDRVPELAANWRGHLAYTELPGVYARAQVVVDQTAEHTAPYGAVNSRVFDALAAGALVVTDNAVGNAELFGGALPVYDGAEELGTLLGKLLADPGAARRDADGLREAVLADHTYLRRAEQLRDLLVARAQRPGIVLQTSAPDRANAQRWGDWHLAEALGRELHAQGHRVALQTADEWGESWGRAYDVSVHLKGRSRPPRSRGQVHVVWNISHPEELTPAECDEADLVLAASGRWADQLRGRTTTPVATLLQATDHRRFFPRPAEARWFHDVAFVGNSRSVFRPVVRDAVDAGLAPAVYGAHWERFVDPGLLRATHVANDQLPVLYSSVKVLLNDHWDQMRRWGFVSNRVFDALACGTAVVSDDLPELAELFGDAVATYDGGPEQLRAVVQRLVADPALRRRMGTRGREAVLAGHTFAVRARELVEALAPLLDARAVRGVRG